MANKTQTVMKAIKSFIIFAGLAFLSACTEKEIMIYENDPKLYFELPGPDGVGIRDSLVYSFPVITAAETNLMVRIRLVGESSPSSRPISIGIVENETTATSDHFSLPASIELPANAYMVDVPVTIKRAGLLNRSVRLVLEIKENPHFSVGFERGRATKLVWGDMYLKPDNWNSSNYLPCWGEFSQAKYGFILRICDILELPPPDNIYLLGYYNALVREALFQYNQNNPPMTDENDALVTIPVWSGGGGGLG